jgi:hypothetical protein
MASELDGMASLPLPTSVATIMSLCIAFDRSDVPRHALFESSHWLFSTYLPVCFLSRVSLEAWSSWLHKAAAKVGLYFLARQVMRTLETSHLCQTANHNHALLSTTWRCLFNLSDLRDPIGRIWMCKTLTSPQKNKKRGQ